MAVPVCVYIYHIFFIHLSISVDTYIAFISLLLKKKKECSEHGGVHICFQISVFVFSEEYPKVEMLDHVIVLCVCVCVCVYLYMCKQMCTFFLARSSLLHMGFL